MDLGAFSISLTVADLARSRAFYETLGFEVVGGEQDENWLILRNGQAVIGLFHGMFDHNILTFNPGLTQDAAQAEAFTDVREIQQALLDAGLELEEPVEEGTTGPGHLTLRDPDGNAILIDQFA